MKKYIKSTVSKLMTIMAIVAFSSMLMSWGEAGHLRVNRAAVLALPDPLRPFFYNHIDFIMQSSPIPDLRRYLLDDRKEAARHYFDLENFGSYDSIPATFQDAEKKYSDDFLSKNGILPWYIEDRMEELTRAFKEKRKTEILFLAADLGHYIADANTPLHVTANYDGQLTGQKGIHSFWETRLVKLFSDTYNYHAGEAFYIKDIKQEIKNMLLNSNAMADTLLRIERELKAVFPEDKIFIPGSEESAKKPLYTDEFASAYHQKLNGMVEKQFQKSILETASFWYTAWINAGKPDLSDHDPAEQTARNRKSLKQDLKLYNKGKLRDII